MSEREEILGRIREALRVPAPRPGVGHAGLHGAPRESTPAPAAFRQWLPPVGATFEERLELFQRQAASLKATFHFTNIPEEISKLLLELSATDGWKKIASHHGQLTDPACGALNLPVCQVDEGYDVREMEGCDAGITECDALVAQTGSVLITNRSAGGRALSVLPPHHVVLARREQMVGDLSEAFQMLKRKYAPYYPSFISFITGPSRTGDIERILVLGAHGPKKLTILCY
jgi:L-lactate dehydrogenase complex protein LldG